MKRPSLNLNVFLQHGRYYYIVVQVEIKNAQKRVTIRAPLQVRNNLDVAVDLIQSGGVRINSNTGDATRGQKDNTISTIQARAVGNLPLFYAHKGNFFIKPSIEG
jgi:hypothetical protein